MRDFESQLQKAPLRRPSPELDRRIQSLTAKESISYVYQERRISLGWAFAAALVMGIIGFAVGAYWQAKQSTYEFSSFPQSQVHIIYYPSDSKPVFDFTQQPRTDFINTDTINIITKGEQKL